MLGGAYLKEPSILLPAEAERLLNAALENPDLELLGSSRRRFSAV